MGGTELTFGGDFGSVYVIGRSGFVVERQKGRYQFLWSQEVKKFGFFNEKAMGVSRWLGDSRRV